MKNLEKVMKGKSKIDILAKILLKLTEKQRAMKEKANLSKSEAVNRLTPRQVQITKLLLEGYSYLEVANVYHMSVNTVRCHARRIYLILGANGRRDLYSRLSNEQIALVRKMFEDIPE